MDARIVAVMPTRTTCSHQSVPLAYAVPDEPIQPKQVPMKDSPESFANHSLDEELTGRGLLGGTGVRACLFGRHERTKSRGCDPLTWALQLASLGDREDESKIFPTRRIARPGQLHHDWWPPSASKQKRGDRSRGISAIMPDMKMTEQERRREVTVSPGER